MVTNSTKAGGAAGIVAFVLLGGFGFGSGWMILGGIGTAAATRYIASRYIFHEQRARDEAKEKLKDARKLISEARKKGEISVEEATHLEEKLKKGNLDLDGLKAALGMLMVAGSVGQGGDKEDFNNTLEEIIKEGNNQTVENPFRQSERKEHKRI